MKKIVAVITFTTATMYSFCVSLYNYSFVGYPQEAFVVFNNPTFYGWLGSYSINSGYGVLLNDVVKNNFNTKWFVAGGNYKKFFAGFAYQNLLLKDIYSEELYVLNFGMKFFNDSLFFASNLKSYVYKYFLDDYYINDTSAETTVNIYEVDFGISKRFTDNIYLGINILNLLTTKAGTSIKYTLPRKFSAYFGYNYSSTVLNFEVFCQDIKVDKFVHSYTGYRLGLNQELYYSKIMSFDITVGVMFGYRNSIFDISLQTKFLSNRLGLKYTVVYTLTDITGYAGNHYIMLNYQPRHIVKRKIVKKEPEVVEEVIVVQPKKVKKKIVAKEKPYNVESQTQPVKQQELIREIPQVSPKETEITEKVTPAEIQEEKLKIVEKKVVVTEYKFPLAHKVKEGETLISISEKYYNNKNKWKKIYEANKDKIIKGVPIVGEVLIIPEP